MMVFWIVLLGSSSASASVRMNQIEWTACNGRFFCYRLHAESAGESFLLPGLQARNLRLEVARGPDDATPRTFLFERGLHVSKTRCWTLVGPQNYEFCPEQNRLRRLHSW